MPEITINNEKCIFCGGCASVCPTGALEVRGTGLKFYPEKCIGCGLCVKVCPANAITLKK